MATINIINLTPHDVVMLDPTFVSFDTRTQHYTITTEAPVRVLACYEASGVVARCSRSEERCSSVNGFDVFRMTFTNPENLPDPTEGTMYIVSNLVAQACPGRSDLLIPAHIVRNPEGQVVGCLCFARA